MRLVCLECSAAYEAPDNLFGPQPRDVRCNRCGYQWTVVASAPEGSAGPAGLSIGPAEAPAPSPPPDLPRPRPAMAPPLRPGPLAAPPPPTPALQGSARLADTLAGPLMPEESPAVAEVPRPVLVVEPAAESTRTLLANAPPNETGIAPPDPEEKRLSHELDFGAADRQRPKSGGGTRRVVVILILLIILAGVAAVVFKTQIITAVPALKPTYAKLGL